MEFKIFSSLLLEIEFICPLVYSQMAATARTAPGRSQEPRIQAGSPTHRAVTQVLGLLPLRGQTRRKLELEARVRIEPWHSSVEGRVLGSLATSLYHVRTPESHAYGFAGRVFGRRLGHEGLLG